MGQISEAKLQLVRGLIEMAPDSAVRNLLLALSANNGLDEGLTRVPRMVEAEATDRQARNLAFSPIAPLCAAAGPFAGISFPPRTLSQIWKALKAVAPDEVAAAKVHLDTWRANEEGPEVLDVLCARTAEGLRSGDPAYAGVAACADAGDGRDVLIACLDIAAVTRGALGHMPEWLGRMTSEKTAKLRLAYADASAVSSDAGPRFFEMLAAHLTEPWLILRVISGVMEHPTETYLASSELRSFGERVLADIDRHVGEVAAFKSTSGRQAAHAAAQAIHLAVIEIAEVELSVALTPDGLWGKRLAGQKKSMAATIEAHLQATEKAVAQALPTKTVRVGPRTVRGVPQLGADADQTLVEKAATLLTFMSEVRSSAPAGGFASVRAKASEGVEERLDAYVEELLEEIRADEGIDLARARAFLEIAAEFCGLARDEKAAQIVRRRAVAAGQAEHGPGREASGR